MATKKHSTKAAEGSAFRRQSFPDLDLSANAIGAVPTTQQHDTEAAPAAPQGRAGRGYGKVHGDQATPNVRRYAFRRT